MSAERPLFFPDQRGHRLFGVYHPPANVTGGPADTAVIYCAPLFEEKLWAHRVGVNFARQAAAAGWPVLRFDYFGDGDSEGLFREASLATRASDVGAAIAHLSAQESMSRFILLGLGLGAVIALQSLARPGVLGAVCWQPVVDGPRYIGEVLRLNLAAQMVLHRKVVRTRDELVEDLRRGETVNVEGYEITQALYKEIAAIDMRAFMAAVTRPTLVLQIAPDAATEPAYRELAAIEPGGLLTFGGVREDRFWTQQMALYPPCTELFSRSLSWMSALAGHGTGA